ncbi:MAG: membrane-bound alpha-1,6- mannosyltransferase Initiation-specific [Stictis urceolatum]|nr:membrane-bound alpha-1,6- mannosyltransferase Initiation-specific [Stictis urceolata]
MALLSFRKAVIVAAFVLTCIFLFPTLHSTPSSKYTPEVAPESNQSQKPQDAQSTSIANAGGLKEAAGPQNGALTEQKPSEQKPMLPEGASLLERLRYQYPYDPDGKFPAYIWQTWKSTPSSGDFAESLRPMEASWSEKHPNFVHEVITDQTAGHLIRYLYASVPEVLEAYKAMPIPVLKADFFRYLILLARGGIYSDIDTEALKSAADWLPKDVPPAQAGLIIGIEADADRPDWKDWYSRRIQFCQWTIQAKVGHPVLRSIVAQITEETLRMKREGHLKRGKLDMSIVEFTGPARWTDTIFNYINDPAYFKIDAGSKNITWESFTGMESPKKVGDVIVLPITSFSPGVQQMGAKEPDDEMAFVKHDFEGSWKQDWEKVKPIVEIPPKKDPAEEQASKKKEIKTDEVKVTTEEKKAEKKVEKKIQA